MSRMRINGFRLLQRGAIITDAHLKEMNACENQRIRFRKEWPNGAKVLKKNLLRAAEMNLDLKWLATQLTTDRSQYRTIMTMLERVLKKAGVPYSARFNWVDGRQRRWYPEGSKAIALAIWDMIK